MMKEIYTNTSNQKAYLDVPVTPTGSTIDVLVKYDTNQVYEVPSVSIETDGRLSFPIPFFLLQSDRKLSVRWIFSYQDVDGQTYEYDNKTTVNIATPLLSLDEVKKIVDDENMSDEDAAEIERSVRYVIQAHTGQCFGKFVGKKSVTGSGGPTLRLPERLIQLNSVNDNTFWNQIFVIRGSGWYLNNRAVGLPSIRADWDGIHENPYTSSAPIGTYKHMFLKDQEYVLDGEWGWNNVPIAVQEAARLLINDYACGDSTYRDRFLTSMTAADWRIQFHEGAFTNTGNVRANQLLSEYVLRRGWVIL